MKNKRLTLEQIFNEMIQSMSSSHPNGSAFNYVYYISPDWPLNQKTPTQTQPNIAKQIERLEHDLQIAEAEERYEDCAKISERINDLKNNYGSYEQQIKQLNEEIQLAVKSQDYLKAAELKAEREKLMKNFE